MRPQITKAEAREKLILLGLIGNGQPITKKAFIEKSNVLEYGRGKKKLRIIFLGIPNQSLFGFYPYFRGGTKAIDISDCYKTYCNIITTPSEESGEELEADLVQWGDKGIPIYYGNVGRW